MVFQKRLTHFLVWVTCDSAEEKNVAAQPHPPTNQVQTCIFQIPLGEALKWYMSAKIPEGGEGFTFWPTDWWGMRRSLHRTFFRPEWPTLTSRSLQSITRPFQKRFRQVFGNARILIFYLSLKAWEEKSLPKCHLGWFFLVFGEGKATKENMSIFWFIWPLNTCSYKKFNEHACLNFFIMVLSCAWFFFRLNFLCRTFIW